MPSTSITNMSVLWKASQLLTVRIDPTETLTTKAKTWMVTEVSSEKWHWETSPHPKGCMCDRDKGTLCDVAWFMDFIGREGSATFLVKAFGGIPSLLDATYILSLVMFGITAANGELSEEGFIIHGMRQMPEKEKFIRELYRDGWFKRLF